MKSRNSRAETCPEQGESTAWLPPDRTGRPKERVRLDCDRILRPERMEEKNQMGEAIRIAAPSSLHGQCGVLETGFGRDFRAAGIEQRCRAGASPKPARNRLDSRSARKWNACFESLTAASRKGMPGSFPNDTARHSCGGSVQVAPVGPNTDLNDNRNSEFVNPLHFLTN